MEKVELQNNHCRGCSCTCNADCKGDVKKCTSKKALEKNCSHGCNCYLAPFVEDQKAKGALSTGDLESRLNRFEMRLDITPEGLRKLNENINLGIDQNHIITDKALEIDKRIIG